MSRFSAIFTAIGLGLGLSGCSFLVDTSPCKPSDCNPGYVCGADNVCVPVSASSGSSSGSTSASTTSGSSSASSGGVSSTGSSGSSTGSSGSSSSSSSSSSSTSSSSTTSSGSTGTSSTSSTSSTSGTTTGSGSSGSTGSGSSSGSTSGGAILTVEPAFAGEGAQIWVCEPGKTIPSQLADSPTGSGTLITGGAPTPSGACRPFPVPSSWSPGVHQFVDLQTRASASFIKVALSPFQAPSGSTDWSQSGNNFLSGAVIYDPGYPSLALVGESDPNLPLLTLASQRHATIAGNPNGLPQLPVAIEPYSALGPASSDRQALVSPASGPVAVVSIDPLGQLTFESELPTSPSAPFISAGDLDGDGVAELVAIGSGPVQIGRLNSPNRPLTYTFSTLAAPIQAVDRGALADVNHDGWTDLVAWGPATDGGAAFQLVAGTPSGLGTAEKTVEVGPGTPIGRPVVFNLPPANDPEASVAGAMSDGGIWVVRNPLSPTPIVENVPTDGEVSGLAAGDLDGDGIPELVVVEHTPGRMSDPEVLKVYQRFSSGFVARPGHVTLSPGTILLGLLDIDGDSRLDIALASISTGHVVYLTGRGGPVISSIQPSFGGPNELSFLTGQWVGQAVALQPTDLDGGAVTAPLLAPTLSPSQAWVKLGGLPSYGPYRLTAAGGDGGTPVVGPEFDLLEPLTSLGITRPGAAPPGTVTCATLGHFRSAGPGMDLLVTAPSGTPGPATIYWEDTGMHTLQQTTGLDLGQLGPPDGGGVTIQNPVACAAIDLNHDGLDDVVVVSDEQAISSLLNQDNQTFGPPHVDRTTSPGIPTRAAFADLDGDGLTDVAVVQAPDNITPYLQAADGTFHPLGTVSSLSAQVDSLVAGDFNGDGQEDLAAMLELTDGGGREVELYLASPLQLPHESSPPTVVTPVSGHNFNRALAAGPLFGLPRDQLVYSDITSAAPTVPQVIDLPLQTSAPTVFNYFNPNVGGQVTVVSLPSQGDAGYPDAVAAFWTPGNTTGLALVSLVADGGASLRTINTPFTQPYGQILAGPVSSRSQLDFVNVPPGPAGGALVEQITTDAGP